MNRQRLLTELAAAACITLAAGAGNASAQGGSAAAHPIVVIGSARVVLPAPQDYVAVTDHPELRRIGESMTSAGNRMLAFYLHRDVHEAARRGDHSGLDRYFIAQVTRTVEAVDLPAADFNDALAELRQNHREAGRNSQRLRPALFKALNGTLAGAPPEPIPLGRGEQVSLGVVHETPRSLAFVIVSDMADRLGIQGETVPVTIATGVVHAGNRIFNLFYAYDGKTTADVVTATTRLSGWVRDVLRANP